MCLTEVMLIARKFGPVEILQLTGGPPRQAGTGTVRVPDAYGGQVRWGATDSFAGVPAAFLA
jgi:hypothetical protein